MKKTATFTITMNPTVKHCNAIGGAMYRHCVKHDNDTYIARPGGGVLFIDRLDIFVVTSNQKSQG